MTASKKKDKVDHAPPLVEVWNMLEERGWLAERSPDVRHKLRNIAQVRTYQRGEPIYTVGKAPEAVYGIARGAVDISVPREDGQEVMIHRAQPGFWVGDLALFSGLPRLVTVTAAAETATACLPKAEIWQLLEQYPDLTLEFYILAHRNVATTLQLLANLSIPRAGARIALCLLNYDQRQKQGEEWLLLSQEKLAELTALSLPTIQRTLRRLEEANIVELGYGRLRILDREQLLSFGG